MVLETIAASVVVVALSRIIIGMLRWAGMWITLVAVFGIMTGMHHGAEWQATGSLILGLSLWFGSNIFRAITRRPTLA